MYSFLPIVIVGIIFFLYSCYHNYTTLLNKSFEDVLTYDYHKKPNYSQKVVLIIESFNDVKDLVTLIQNILQQQIKVDSIILISENEELKKVKLIRNTCIFNSIGGLTFLLKESSSDTILVYIFSEGFNAFEKPNFLTSYLKSDNKVYGLIKVNNESISIGNLQKVYN